MFCCNRTLGNRVALRARSCTPALPAAENNNNGLDSIGEKSGIESNGKSGGSTVGTSTLLHRGKDLTFGMSIA